MLSVAVFALVLPLVLGHQLGWPLWTWLSLAGSVVVFAGFAALQRRTALSGGTPLIPSRVLSAPGLLPAALAILCAMSTYAGFLFSMALHIQNGLGYSPARAGLVFVPGATAFAISSLNWRRIPARWHRRMIPVALLVATGGYVGQALAVHNGGSIGLAYWAANVFYGLGFGAAFSPLLTVALTHVAPADAADASGIVATVAQLAQVIGVATFGTLFLSLVHQPAESPHGATATNLALAAACLVAVLASLGLPKPTSVNSTARAGSGNHGSPR